MRPDDHHFHWIAARYKKQLFPGPYSSVPAEFRNLPTNRGILPRQFHNVLHKYTLPPEVPELEDMIRYLESFAIARRLFKSAKRLIRVQGLSDQSDDEGDLKKINKRYDEVFNTYSRTKHRALGAQALSNIGERDVSVESSPDEVVELLGSCALLRVPNYTHQYFTSQEAVA